MVAMGVAAGRISLAASGQSQAVEGQVCITASDAMPDYWLPAVLKRVREMAPGIDIEVVASNEVRDLRRREADIAIRHVRPDQPDLIARLVGEISASLRLDHLSGRARPSAENAVCRQQAKKSAGEVCNGLSGRVTGTVALDGPRRQRRQRSPIAGSHRRFVGRWWLTEPCQA
jgi:DNA-binding transcriptional LysR family regulator